MNKEVENELRESRVGLVHFADISELANKQNRGLPRAILIGIAINPKFVRGIFNNSGYKPVLEDEYVETKNRVGEVVNELVEFLVSKEYKVSSRSDAGLSAEGVFNFEMKESALPHKTVAQLSGLGWIGKNNLFITLEYGAAQCLGTVLTNAPLETVPYALIFPKCGSYSICKDIRERKVPKGTTWNTTIPRDDIIDVYGCSTCLKCLVYCPWTQKYVDFKSRFLQPQRDQPDYSIYKPGQQVQIKMTG